MFSVKNVSPRFHRFPLISINSWLLDYTNFISSESEDSNKIYKSKVYFFLISYLSLFSSSPPSHYFPHYFLLFFPFWLLLLLFPHSIFLTPSFHSPFYLLQSPFFSLLSPFLIPFFLASFSLVAPFFLSLLSLPFFSPFFLYSFP